MLKAFKHLGKCDSVMILQVITFCVKKVNTFCVEKLLHFALNTLLHFASMLLHFASVLHFAAIVITFCVSITFCSDYYILRRNTSNKEYKPIVIKFFPRSTIVAQQHPKK